MNTVDPERGGSGSRDRFPDDRDGTAGHDEPELVAPEEIGTGQGESDQGESEVELARPKKASEAPEQLARDTVYRLLAARARSRSELMQALQRKGIGEDVATDVLDKFEAAGLIDDAAFAESWVRQRHEHQGLGRRALHAELRRKGVDEQAAADALSQMDEDAEAQRARELVRRKVRGMRAVEPVARTRRLVAMLARKGYSEGMAFRVVREETEDSENAECSTVDGVDVDDPDSR